MPSSRTPLPDAVILDADGTLCDVRSVQHFVRNPDGTRAKKPNFYKFHSGSAGCPPHDRVKQLALDAHDKGLAVVVATGREAQWRDLTAKWLAKHGIPCDALLTRGVKDYRPDHVVKKELLQQIRRRYNPVLAVDDRPDIIEVWQGAGIPTVQVGEEGALMPVEVPQDTELNPRVEVLLA